MIHSDYTKQVEQLFSNVPYEIGQIETPWARELINFLLRTFSASRPAIVDLGCGAGALDNYLTTIGCEVIGIDLTSIVCKAKIKYPALKMLPFDLNYGIPIDDNVVDIAYSAHAIGYLKDPNFFISEIRRVTKPNSHVILATPNSTSPLEIMRDIKKHLRHLEGVRGLSQRSKFSFRSLKKLLALHHFEIVEHYYYSNRQNIIQSFGETMLVIGTKVSE